MSTKGAIIALAWPDTKVTQEGKWYDTPMRWLGFIKNGYYTVGHAAFVLVDSETLEFKYYDFGRYHTPAKHGRVRSYDTDPELKLNTKAELMNGEIINLEALMNELQSKKSCHGDGELWASIYYNVDIAKAKKKASKMQDKGTICYGPLNIGGTNCSRFVAQVTKASTTCPFMKFKLTVPYTVSASPKFNIRIINQSSNYYVLSKDNTSLIKNKTLIPKFSW
jgi:hypothetical protein